MLSTLSNNWLQIRTLARKEVSDNRQSRLLLVMTLFMVLAGVIALVVAAIALRAEVTTYQESLQLLLSLGKPPDALVQPDFLPLKLLRGFIEYIEIIGAVLGIVLGQQAAAKERSYLTLPLLLSRPMSRSTFLLGKLLGNLGMIIVALLVMFVIGALGISLIGRISLGLEDLLRIGTSFIAAVLFVGSFFLLGFWLTLRAKRPAHALLLAFTLWLVFVLVTPQIGDTLDPDNQVGAGVFRTLSIPKVQEKQIMQSFKTYETVRDSIEQSSPAKHFERLSFAVLGIKATYTGMPLAIVISERRNDAYWLLGLFATLSAGLFLFPGIRPNTWS